VTVATAPLDDLRGLTAAVLRGAGVPAADAELVADSLVCADAWGHASHGVLRVPSYVARLRAGVMRAVTRVDVAVDAGAVAVLDGHDGVGQVIAAAAAREAVQRARTLGASAVAVRNSNHVGCLAYFTRMAAAQGCVALFASNASPAMAPAGGRAARVGTNPWSVAAPAPDGRAIVMDIANTAVARGKIHLARERGTRIPLGWAVDAAGVPTTDPERALAGLVLPMAGHKGYAIAVLLDVLTGVLSGSAIGSEVAGPYQAERRGGNGQLFIALDVERFLEPDTFVERVGRLIADVKSAPAAEAADEILVPGELEDRAAERAARDGVALAERTRRELWRLAGELGVDDATRAVVAP